MIEKIKQLLQEMKFNPPATEIDLRNVEKEIGMSFPPQYKEFMLESNGAEGSVGDNSYLAIWSVEEIVPLNEAGGVEQFTPGLVYFASDGGGTAYAFDKRTENVSIVETPDDSIDIEEAELCGNTFMEFLQYLYDYNME